MVATFDLILNYFAVSFLPPPPPPPPYDGGHFLFNSELFCSQLLRHVLKPIYGHFLFNFELFCNQSPPPPPPPCQSVIYYNQVRMASATLEAIYVATKWMLMLWLPVLCRCGVILTLGRWGWRGSDSASCRSYTAHIVSCRSYTAHIASYLSYDAHTASYLSYDAHTASYLSYDAHTAKETQGWSIITALNSSSTLCTQRENIIKDKVLNDTCSVSK